MDLIRRYLAPVLMVLIATHHLIRVTDEKLTTWKGGGFGMFASLDQQRFAKIYVSREGQFFPVNGPSDAAGIELYRRALALPTEERAERLAADIHSFLELPEDRQVVVATFGIRYHAQRPPRVEAKSVHMVSSRPELSGNRLQWRW